MSRRLDWSRRALGELRAIRRRDQGLADRIGSAIRTYADEGRGDVLKLAGGGDLYRLRVGDWRVLFVFEDGGRTIGILRVVNRRDAYRD